MSRAMNESSELYGLLNELVEGALTDPQAARLHALLVDHPEAQARYRDFIRLHAELAFDYAGGSIAVAMPATPSMPQTPAPASPDTIEDLLLAVPSRWRWLTSRPASMVLGGVIAMAAAAAILLACRAMLTRPGGGSVVTADAAAIDGPVTATAPGGLGVVVRLQAVRWGPSQWAPSAEGDVVRPGRLRLLSGRATVLLYNGVTLTVEGPADLELVSEERLFCHQGILRARVPAGAEGFVVASVGVSVVDHGTEFALNVRSDGRVQVIVFEGAAEVSTYDERRGGGRSQMVEASEAYEADPGSGNIKKSDLRPEDFVAPPQFTTPGLKLEPDYPETVLASRPWSYWRFESKHDDLYLNEIPGRPPLRAHGPVGPGQAARGNRTAVFGPDRTDQCLIMEESWEPDPRLGYAVELWCLSEGFRHSSLAGLVAPGPPQTSPHLLLLELTAQRRQLLFPPASVRYLHRWPPGDSGGDNLFSREHFSAYRWHHVVAQLNGSRMELFTDGALSSSSSVVLDDETTPCRLLLGLLNGLPVTPVARMRCLVGQLDEVALYDHPLPAAEVREHFRKAAMGVDTSRD
jgi:hypothetical protein